MRTAWTRGMVGHGEQVGCCSRVVFVAVLLLLAGATVAEPCGVIVFKHEPDAAERQIDRQPPGQVAATAVRIARGTRSSGGCNDTGFMEIDITGAKDDRTPQASLSYRITLVAGTLPPGLALPSYAYRGFRVVEDVSREVFRLSLAWGDRATDQEAIDFTVTVTAVDLAGNESVPSLPIRVRHPGGPPARQN